MAMGPPGENPVADHTWCCEHPEPWNYFTEEAEGRLLSGLSRVFRVDPVETTWSLRIAEWAATAQAIPVLKMILAENSVTPKVRRNCSRLLQHVGGEPEEDEPRDWSPMDCLDVLGQAVDEGNRYTVSRLLAHRLPELESVEERVGAVSELMAIGFPQVDRVLNDWMKHWPNLSQEDEARLLLAAAASGRDTPFEFLCTRLEKTVLAPEIYDVYEMVRALCRALPPTATDSRLEQLFHILRRRPWWKAADREDWGQMVVVASALTRGRVRHPYGATGLRKWWSRSQLKGHYHYESLGYAQDPRSLDELGKGLRDAELFVRRAAALALRLRGTAGSIEILKAHVTRRILTGRLPLDIEGAESVRLAMDGVLFLNRGTDRDWVFGVFQTPLLATHDLRQRAALTLAMLGDDRCLEIERESGMPAVIQAAISPLASGTGDLLENSLVRVARWLNETRGAGLGIPESHPTHLERVALSRQMVAWGLGGCPSQGGSGNA